MRIGVALGGGAARGMSHLGVLKALEQSGIVVDMIAGTSAGAMTGIVYASGLDRDYSATQFAADLRPSWIFRHLPHGNHWYLLYKYRRGHFDPMLRKYLHDWRLEQLAVPCLSVTVDLVGGNSVVRERGDAVHAILESINLPVLSVPIVRDGQALIDGGLVNNIPADVLVSMGCNFVIAVSVTAKMEKEFCDITPGQPARPRKKPGIVPTILRSLLVQNHNLNAFGVQPADVVIEPDVTGFELTEFMRAKELAAIGEAAALEQIPKIKQLLARLDPQLFPLDGGTCTPSEVIVARLVEIDHRSEPQVHSLQPRDGLGHQRVFLRLVLRDVRHREAQVRPGVVPRHAADRSARGSGTATPPRRWRTRGRRAAVGACA